MNYSRNLKNIIPSILIFFISIIYFIITLIINYSEKEPFLIWKSITDSSFIFLFISSFTVPGFILHYRYERLNRKRKITFKQNYLEITTDTEIKNVLYSDILEVQKHIVLWKEKNPWSHYSYVKLILKNKEKIYYNSLTKRINSENNLLKSNRIKKYEIEDIWPLY